MTIEEAEELHKLMYKKLAEETEHKQIKSITIEIKYADGESIQTTKNYYVGI